MAEADEAASEERSPGDPSPEDDVEMTFFEHLTELRTRLIRALVGILPFFGVAWYFREQILEWLAIPWNRAAVTETIDTDVLWLWLTHPYPQSAEELQPVELHYTGPMDPFIVYLVMSAIVGLIIASPWVFWQIYGFVAPGLYRREKRLVFPFIGISTVFFLAGCYFGYALVLPLAYQTFLQFGGEVGSGAIVLTEIVTIDSYLSLTARLLVAFGVTFQVPVVIAFLSFAGLVNWKQLVKFGRWWLVISVVVAALLTPPDPGSQLMMAIPLNVLYWVSVVFAFLFGPKVVKPGDKTEEGFER